MDVVITKECEDYGYTVRVEGGRGSMHAYTKSFLWGMFDDGDVSWQRARSDARAYAKSLATKLGCRVLI